MDAAAVTRAAPTTPASAAAARQRSNRCLKLPAIADHRACIAQVSGIRSGSPSTVIHSVRATVLRVYTIVKDIDSAGTGPTNTATSPNTNLPGFSGNTASAGAPNAQRTPVAMTIVAS